MSARDVQPSDGDPFSDAVAALYHARFESLFRYLDRLSGDADLARDLAQDTFIRLHRRGAMPDDPPAWLATVATNLFRDQRRQARRRTELVTRHAADAVELTEAPAADADLLVYEVRSRARRALDALPERERILLLLRHEGYSYRELARAVGVAESSVGTLLVRATRLFRNAVGAEPSTSGAGAPGSCGVRHASL